MASILQTVASEPGSMTEIASRGKLAHSVIGIYSRLLVKRGLLKTEVGEGVNGKLVVKFRLSDSGRTLLPKLHEVLDILNP